MKKLNTLIFKPDWINEGVGARVIRVIGNEHLSRLSPFLMLDYFNVSLPAGFPDHPHRGFETVTYMISGELVHEDFKGHKGRIGPGGIQWMTTGKGIVHCQMPTSFDVPSIGFQLWLNLKAQNKLVQPRYQELKANQMPIVSKEGVNIKVISGEWGGVKGPITCQTPVYYLDTQFQGKGRFQIDIDQRWNAIVFVYQGELTYTDENKEYQVKLNHCVRLSNGLRSQKFTGYKAKFLVIAGQPIPEPVEQHGPFVMNTRKELSQAIQDYQTGKNGFEGVGQWESEIKNLPHSK